MSEIKALGKLEDLVQDINEREINDHIIIERYSDGSTETGIGRDWVCAWREAALRQLHAIEREIAERYLELPVDADGVPIRVGDLIEYHDRDGAYKLHAQGVYVYSNGRLCGEKCVMNERLGIWEPDKCSHVQPRKLEDVLRDVWKEALDYAKSDMWRNPDEVFVERADEIRELLGVNE